MSRFRDLSIRSKLMTGFMLTSLAVLLLTLAALAAYDRMAFRGEVLRDVDTLAGIIGENASSSVALNDRQTAQATLAPLRAPTQVTGAPRYAGRGAGRRDIGRGARRERMVIGGLERSAGSGRDAGGVARADADYRRGDLRQQGSALRYLYARHQRRYAGSGAARRQLDRCPAHRRDPAGL